ncbi:hypothetical protein BHE74_00049753, partial [Ensete ventricosum]
MALPYEPKALCCLFFFMCGPRREDRYGGVKCYHLDVVDRDGAMKDEQVKQQQVQEPHGEEKNHQSQQQHQEDDIHKHGKHGVRSDPMEKVKLGSSGEGWRWKRIERDREDDGGNSNVIGNPANKVSTSFGWIRRGDVDALWRDRWAPTR